MTSPASALALAIVFALTVRATPEVYAQTFTVIRTFTGGGDGAHPFSTLTLDPGGNLYGTTTWGGPNNCSPPYECGTVFKLTHGFRLGLADALYL